MKVRGFTLIELLIVIGVVAILFAIAVPWLLNARMAANEAAAVSALGAINDAQALYRETCGKGRYAADLPALGMPMPNTGNVFLSPDLTAGAVVIKSGYELTLHGPEPGETAQPEEPAQLGAEMSGSPLKGCNDADTIAGYVATADPVRPGNSGRRYFGTNTSRVIYEHLESLVKVMPESGAPPAGAELK